MKETLEGLWKEYLLEECAVIETDEERRLTKKTGELHEKANSLLNKEQEEAVDGYVDALCDANALFVKKAFFKGCEFVLSFLLEVGTLGK
jgi:hypothetical protein